MREGGMIRFVKMAVFREFSRPFSYVRRLPPEDSVVKVHTIRFVGLPFIFASRGDWRTDAWRQMTGKAQMPKPKSKTNSKCQNPNDK